MKILFVFQFEGCNCAGWKSLATGRNFLFPPSNAAASTSDNQMDNLNEPCRNCSHTFGSLI